MLITHIPIIKRNEVIIVEMLFKRFVIVMVCFKFFRVGMLGVLNVSMLEQ